ncbi:MAG TPA: acetate/propionate family kinase [Bryobacteraceae bacterium]|nr:acetate/propionate family kinase [Bryobacteraceae bacterium]
MERLNTGGAEQPVLALNCGSSSLKFGVYLCTPAGNELLAEGEAEEIGTDHSTFWFGRGDERQREQIELPDHSAALSRAFAALNERNVPAPAVVGHRFVHGGPQIREHQVLRPTVMEQLRAAAVFAPLHVPPALAVLEATQQKLPEAPQIVCLDTAFHRTMPEVAKVYALPARIRELGVERYGFHGLSLESVLEQLEPVPERVVIAHLGNGSSITAVRKGASMDTTMGLTPTGGVMMGSRCGDLDPGIFVFLMRNGFASADELEAVFNDESGLRGISEKTSDVRELLKIRPNEKSADLALRVFCYQVRKAIASMAAALGGLELLIFTGGIGEHAAELRDEICTGLGFMGSYTVKVLPSQEDLQIARITTKIASRDQHSA